MLECPCTDRKKKIITRHNTQESDVCSNLLVAPIACYAAATALGLSPILLNATIADTAKPAGCFVLPMQAGYEVYFNTADSSAQCGPAPRTLVRSSGREDAAGVRVTLGLDEGVGNCSKATSDLSGTWSYNGEPYGPSHTTAAPYVVTVAAVPATHGDCLVTGGPCASPCPMVANGSQVVVHFPAGPMTAKLSSDWSTWTFTSGATGAAWTRPTKVCTGEAIITIAGPSNVWFGIGLDAEAMSDKPYTIVVHGDGGLEERVLGDHEQGSILTCTNV
jgi:hypothetical protein